MTKLSDVRFCFVADTDFASMSKRLTDFYANHSSDSILSQGNRIVDSNGVEYDIIDLFDTGRGYSMIVRKIRQ